jgi:putative tricarboxylic transport membrane protein
MARKRLASLFLLALSIFFSVQSYSLGMGNVHNPGAGFIPFFSGIALGCLSLTAVIKTTGKKRERVDSGGNWKKPLWVLGSLTIYVILFERLGFLVASFLFLIFSLLNFRPRRLLGILIVSFVTVSLSYIVFGLWLRVQLPKGVLGF